MRVLVTGADGFVGQQLCRRLRQRGLAVRAGLLRSSEILARDIEQIVIGDISAAPDLSAALAGVDAIVHLAARVHVMEDEAPGALQAFRAVNLEGTKYLARLAVQAGIRRLVYVSTIKVNGEETARGQRFTEADPPRPQDPYAISKWQAECALRQIEASEGLEVAIVRPPLVYGPGVKGNLLRLLGLLRLRLPIPLGRVDNRRSLISLASLTDLLCECVVNRRAAGETFLVSDRRDLSTPELLRVLAKGLGYRLCLLPVPLSLINLVGDLLGKRDVVQRLCGSLVVDSSRSRRVLDWTPPQPAEEGLMAMARWYQSRPGR